MMSVHIPATTGLTLLLSGVVPAPALGAESSPQNATQRDFIAGVNHFLSGSNVKLQANWLRQTYGGFGPARDQLLLNLQTAW